MNGWCFRGIYKGGLWENDLHVSARMVWLEGIIFTMCRRVDSRKLARKWSSQSSQNHPIDISNQDAP